MTSKNSFLKIVALILVVTFTFTNSVGYGDLPSSFSSALKNSEIYHVRANQAVNSGRIDNYLRQEGLELPVELDIPDEPVLVGRAELRTGWKNVKAAPESTSSTPYQRFLKADPRFIIRHHKSDGSVTPERLNALIGSILSAALSEDLYLDALTTNYLVGSPEYVRLALQEAEALQAVLKDPKDKRHAVVMATLRGLLQPGERLDNIVSRIVEALHEKHITSLGRDLALISTPRPANGTSLGNTTSPRSELRSVIRRATIEGVIAMAGVGVLAYYALPAIGITAFWPVLLAMSATIIAVGVIRIPQLEEQEIRRIEVEEFKRGMAEARANRWKSDRAAFHLSPADSSAPSSLSRSAPKAKLERGHVIANQIMVSGHLALVPSLFSLSHISTYTGPQVIQFIFASWDTLISGIFWYASFHINVWWHERAHYWEAVRQLTLRKDVLEKVQDIEKLPLWNPRRLKLEAEMFIKAPYGKFPGIKYDKLSYYVDAPYNLTVTAAGPLKSGQLAYVLLPLSAALIGLGYTYVFESLILIGRFLLPIATVALFDRLLADHGAVHKLREREKQAEEASRKVASTKTEKTWLDEVPNVKERMRATRMQKVIRADGTEVNVPWGYRNSAMGGAHTEKEYPESNISLQEGMFIPLSAKSIEEGQEMTVALQNRLKEIIEKTPGSRVMGIGLEGGLAPYVTPDEGDLVPELKLWRMMTQAIKDLGYTPGVDVALALDAAASELENAYREQINPDAVGQYLFWRDKAKVVMTREELLALYKRALEEGIPFVSIEDGFSERDDEGFALFQKEFGDKLWRIGDDLVTTNDRVVEEKADKGLLNALLTKYNQIGTLSETVLAMVTALGNGLELVISHRSKSPNDDGEAQVAMGSFALGLKAGGGANTERLVKYQAIAKMVQEALTAKGFSGEISDEAVDNVINQLVVTNVTAYEEPTNAGVPTVGIEVIVGIKGHPKFDSLLRFTGSTPLGTSAGTLEAIHLVDSIIEKNEQTEKYSDLFKYDKDGQNYQFKKGIKKEDVEAKNDAELLKLWNKAQRYGGKGTLNAVQNSLEIIKPKIVGKKASDLGGLADIDSLLLSLELEAAKARGKDVSNPIYVMQRKGNIGMNAILSMSLALSRFKSAVEGKHLWETIREEMVETMKKTIKAELGEDVNIEVKTREDWDQLVAKLREVKAKLKSEGKPLYEALRKQLPVYDFANRSELRHLEPSLNINPISRESLTMAGRAALEKSIDQSSSRAVGPSSASAEPSARAELRQETFRKTFSADVQDWKWLEERGYLKSMVEDGEVFVISENGGMAHATKEAIEELKESWKSNRSELRHFELSLNINQISRESSEPKAKRAELRADDVERIYQAAQSAASNAIQLLQDRANNANASVDEKAASNVWLGELVKLQTVIQNLTGAPDRNQISRVKFLSTRLARSARTLSNELIAKHNSKIRDVPAAKLLHTIRESLTDVANRILRFLDTEAEIKPSDSGALAADLDQIVRRLKPEQARSELRQSTAEKIESLRQGREKAKDRLATAHREGNQTAIAKENAVIRDYDVALGDLGASVLTDRSELRASRFSEDDFNSLVTNTLEPNQASRVIGLVQVGKSSFSFPGFDDAVPAIAAILSVFERTESNVVLGSILTRDLIFSESDPNGKAMLWALPIIAANTSDPIALVADSAGRLAIEEALKGIKADHIVIAKSYPDALRKLGTLGARDFRIIASERERASKNLLTRRYAEKVVFIANENIGALFKVFGVEKVAQDLTVELNEKLAVLRAA